MTRGLIHQLIDSFMKVSRELSVNCDCADAEAMAVMVFRIMSYQTRQFHTLEHVFSFIDEDTHPHIILAAIFHDVVYYQIDDGFQPELKNTLDSFAEITGEGVRIIPDEARKHPLLAACTELFGFKPGQILHPFEGLNEFLSAAVFVRLFSPHLKVSDIAGVLTCIEASIPFRPCTNNNPFGQLAARLKKLRDDGYIDSTEEEMSAMIKRAVQFSNKDVKDFALDDPGLFLNNTWKLLPELNSSLRSHGCYTISEYRVALGKMLGFFSFLNPENIYHYYEDTPPAAEIARLVEASRKNLKIAIRYLNEKLLAVSLIEAVALASGGDSLISLFLGDIPRDGFTPEQLQDYLPKDPKPQADQENDPVFRLIRDGRLDDASFDLKNSPLARYLYLRIPEQQRFVLMSEMNSFFKGDRSAREYLQLWDKEIVREIVDACRKIVPTRNDALKKLLD